MSVDEFRTELVIDNLRAKVASLTAENERLRTDGDGMLEANVRLRDERDAARAEVEYRKATEADLRAALSSLRELESAVRKWRESHPEIYLDRRDTALIAAVDALPPIPPAAEGSDGETT